MHILGPEKKNVSDEICAIWGQSTYMCLFRQWIYLFFHNRHYEHTAHVRRDWRITNVFSFSAMFSRRPYIVPFQRPTRQLSIQP